MKKIILALILLFSLSSFAQHIEISPYGGFTFGGKILADNGKLAFHSSAHGGLNFNFFLNDNHGIYVDYMLQTTKVDVWHTDISNDKDVVDINLSWYQLGYIYKTTYQNFYPFAGFSLGATYIQPRETQMYPTSVFSLTGFAGLDYNFNDYLGLRLTGKFLYPAGFGNELEYQSGIAGDPIVFKSNFVQGSLSLGIYFRI